MKAIVVGGSNGIGLGISKVLIEKGYFIEIFDITIPDNILDKNSYRYHYCNLLDFDESIFNEVNDESINVLILTAGVGKIQEFKDAHISDIDKFFKINTISAIKILKIFYDKLLSNDNFYTCVLTSISSILVSPCASIYSASKSALAKFIEAINIELEVNKSKNRILDVCPGKFDGSRFYGGSNDISKLEDLANDIISHLFDKDTFFIPLYDEVYRNVINKYHNDPDKFGIESYEYKKNTGRLGNCKKAIIGYLSGTFDLFHIGHLNLIRKAKENCDYLIVGVHKNAAHKGKETFIPLKERKEIIKSCKYVDKVIDSYPDDSDVWKDYHYNILFVGSDYEGTERFRRYEEYFKDKGVKIMYFPYTQGTSSTQLRNAISS